MSQLMTRRQALRGLAVSSVTLALAACQPKVVEKIVKETVVVKEEVAKEVTKIVEKEVTKVVEKEKVVEKTVPVARKRGKVVFWHIFGSGASRDIFDRIIAEFNETSETTLAEPVFAEFWTYEQKVLAAVAAGDPPDVTMADMTRTGQRAEAKQIIALTDFVNQDKFDLSPFVPYAVKDVQYKGEIWGIPFGPDTRILYYNKDYFKEVGLDPKKPPKTWDELWEYAHKLDKKDDKGNWTRIGFNPQWGNVWVLPFVWSNGAELVTASGEIILNDEKVIETAKWYKKWVDYYGHEALTTFASGFGSGANDPFISGQVAMIVQTNGFIGTLLKFGEKLNWGAGLIPHNGTPASWGAGFDLEIPTGAKNPSGAWEFIKFLVDKPTAIKWAQASGWFPARMDAAEDPALASVPAWNVVLESMKVTKSRAFVLECPTWYGPLIKAFAEVWDGVKTPEQALNDAQQEVLKEIENFRATRK